MNPPLGGDSLDSPLRDALRVVAALLARAGGELTISAEELEQARDRRVGWSVEHPDEWTFRLVDQ